jgi:hypothetical protein
MVRVDLNGAFSRAIRMQANPLASPPERPLDKAYTQSQKLQELSPLEELIRPSQNSTSLTIRGKQFKSPLSEFLNNKNFNKYNLEQFETILKEQAPIVFEEIENYQALKMEVANLRQLLSSNKAQANNHPLYEEFQESSMKDIENFLNDKLSRQKQYAFHCLEDSIHKINKERANPNPRNDRLETLDVIEAIKHWRFTPNEGFSGLWHSFWDGMNVRLSLITEGAKITRKFVPERTSVDYYGTERTEPAHNELKLEAICSVPCGNDPKNPSEITEGIESLRDQEYIQREKSYGLYQPPKPGYSFPWYLPFLLTEAKALAVTKTNAESLNGVRSYKGELQTATIEDLNNMNRATA